MNIKSLLLGSAAAAVAFTGAQAADAIVIAEPEPLEYVRICDAYGAGFFYIPGTETCLKIGGYMQYDIGFGDRHAVVGDAWSLAIDTDPFDVDLTEGREFETWYKRARLNLTLDARSDTEWGTLRGYFSGMFDYTTAVTSTFSTTDTGIALSRSVAGVSSFTAEFIYVEFAGFRVGLNDSLFSTGTGYGSALATHSGLLPYGPFSTHQIAYTYSGANGLTVALALENGAGFTGGMIDDYMPHVVGHVGITQGWGSANVVAAYDSINESWAAKARVGANLGGGFTAWVMGGIQQSDRANVYANWGGRWMIQGAVGAPITSTATLNVTAGYDDNSRFAAGANVAWRPVTNLLIQPEVNYVKPQGADGQWGGWLRFRRSF